DVLREVEIHVETRETRQHVNRHLGKEHAPLSVIREGEGQIGKEVLLLDLLGSHRGELLPGGAAQTRRRTDRNRLSPGHQGVSRRWLEVVSRRQERGVDPGALSLDGEAGRLDLIERHILVVGSVTGDDLRGLRVDGEGASPYQGCGTHECKEHSSLFLHQSLLFFAPVPSHGPSPRSTSAGRRPASVVQVANDNASSSHSQYGEYP